MSSTQKRAILQVRIREEDKQHAEHLYDAMGTSLAEAVRLFVAQSILMRKLPFQPVAVRSKDGTAAYGSLKAYGDPNRRAEERNAWVEYLATESDDSITAFVANPGTISPQLRRGCGVPGMYMKMALIPKRNQSHSSILWSGRRESNPRHQLGRLGFYH